MLNKTKFSRYGAISLASLYMAGLELIAEVQETVDNPDFTSDPDTTKLLRSLIAAIDEDAIHAATAEYIESTPEATEIEKEWSLYGQVAATEIILQSTAESVAEAINAKSKNNLAFDKVFASLNAAKFKDSLLALSRDLISSSTDD